MAELIKKTIQITDVGLEESKISVFDENKKKYSIWKTKKDGTPTVAYTAFEPFCMQATGKNFDISHDEKPVPDNANAFYRSIMTIRPSTGAPTQNITSNQPVTVVSGMNYDQEINSLKTAVSMLKGRLDQLAPQTAPEVQNTPPTAPHTQESNEEVNVEDIPF